MILTLALLLGSPVAPPTQAALLSRSTSAIETIGRLAERCRLALADRYDCVLLLERTPLHVRLHVTLNGLSQAKSRDGVVARLVQSVDADRDGKILRKEVNRSPYVSGNGVARGNTGFLDFFKNNEVVEPAEVRQAIEGFAGKNVQLLQTDTAAQADQALFNLLDQNRDGKLDDKELAEAEKKLLDRDIDNDECVTPIEITATVRTSASLFDLINQPTPVSVANANLLRHFPNDLKPDDLLQLYDRDKDKMLADVELGWTAGKLASFDKNADRKLDAKELAALIHGTPDIELHVQLGVRPLGGPMVKVLSTTAPKQERDPKSKQSSLTFSEGTLVFAGREVDPIARAKGEAAAAFIRSDTDGNGYVDQAESRAFGASIRDPLFTAMDADSNQMLFRNEMDDYVERRVELLATSCVVTIDDRGYGFFATLDRNGDGRLSKREMAQAKVSLAYRRKPADKEVAATGGVRDLQVTLARGTLSIFAQPNMGMQSSNVVVANKAPRQGPIWFRRMDRNRDGDLSWKEFLGAKSDFSMLDRDGDGLIDPQEAEQIPTPTP